MNAIIIFLILIIDQSSKFYLIQYLKTLSGWVLTINPYLNFVFIWNYGISFGLFDGFGRYGNIIFIILNITITLFLFYLIAREKQKFVRMCYSFIIGGALGNISDRIFRGAVFDFINVHYNNYHFAVFNIADSFITAGITLLVLRSVKISLFK